MGNAYVVVIDGLGVGAQEDAEEYGDAGTNTLAHVCEETKCRLPNLQKMGLGNIIPLASVPPQEQPLAAYGKMREISGGKDSTTGHWEIAGITMEHPFPTYPDGFPPGVLKPFCKYTGAEKVLCNAPYSGTEVIKDYGDEHMETGNPIVYTSADSVFQVACHVDKVSLDSLYDWCEYARENILQGKHGVGRVIARPFTGSRGSYERISKKRHDFSLKTPEKNILTALEKAGIKRYAIGKIVDLFAGQQFTQFRRTKSNAEGISQLLSLMSAAEDSFVFVNLIDTDQKYGHRQDPEGYANSLQEFDRCVPALVSKLEDDDLLIITGDHGNDPTDESTDHTREFVPLLVFPTRRCVGKDLSTRDSFSDIAVSLLHFFKVNYAIKGQSFIG